MNIKHYLRSLNETV